MSVLNCSGELAGRSAREAESQSWSWTEGEDPSQLTHQETWDTENQLILAGVDRLQTPGTLTSPPKENSS